MKNENVTTLKRTYCKVYKTSDSFRDDEKKQDVLFDVYYVKFDDEKIKLNNQQLRDSILFPFISRLVDYFEETDEETGEVVSYFKLYSEKVVKKDKDGKPVVDKNGNYLKNTLFYVLLNGKKGYLPGWVLKFKAPEGSKTKDRDLELPFKAADRFTEEYTIAPDSMKDLEPVNDDIPF